MATLCEASLDAVGFKNYLQEIIFSVDLIRQREIVRIFFNT